ncbi:uncharacterized protein LOC128982820 [Macrosteles quadrilineatus]|uniref:uncharacterized protein LOC128982820 n=1 Tax=Macrosteles quadrilineatus TaxID=74068 RepID=UPI0023E320D6|nr:uncharacterized protein LOC128982820 [Macrosteles quadrilineatus]
MAAGVWGLVIFLVVQTTFALPTNSEENEVVPGLRILRKLYDDCSKKDSAMMCLKGKAITFFDRASRSDSISVGDLVTLVREEGSRVDYGRAITETDLETVSQGADETSRDAKLNDLLFDRVARFFNSHSVKLSLPKMSSEELARGYEEGRGKMKKMMSMMMMMVMMKKMMLIPIALIGLFLLAGKAFIISKIALILTLIITLKKLLNSKMEEHHHEHSSGHGGGWDRRSFGLGNELAHELAYSAYLKQD